MSAKDILAELGLTPEEAEAKILDRIVSRILAGDGDADECPYRGEFEEKLRKQAQAAIDAKVEEIGEKFVVPAVHKLVDEVTLRETNKWGEVAGKKSFTFKEYLVERAKRYCTQPVDIDGKPADPRRYGSNQKQSRIAHLIDQHLYFAIEKAIKEQAKEFNDRLQEGLNETLKIQLQDFMKSVRVRVSR